MLKIIHHQGNTNQNHIERAPHTYQKGYHQTKRKKTNNKCWQGGGEMRILCTVGMYVNLCNHYENNIQFPQKRKNRTTV